MLDMSPDRKRFLLRQYKPKHSSHATTVATFSPTTGSLFPRLAPQLTGEAIKKRFSIGWGASTSSDSINESEWSPSRRDSVVAPPKEPEAIQPQSTGGLWSSWWNLSAGSPDKAKTERMNTENGTSPSFYTDGLKAGKVKELKLTKLLISLRVHLSTAKLVWIQEFVGQAKGLEALGGLLNELVGKGGKRKEFVEYEAVNLLEVVKCLRVLMNNEVSTYPREYSGRSSVF